MCSYGRCPESMWLFNNTWHGNSLFLKDDYELDPDYVVSRAEKTTTESPIDYLETITEADHHEHMTPAKAPMEKIENRRTETKGISSNQM